MGPKFLEAIFFRRRANRIIPTHSTKIMATNTIIINNQLVLKGLILPSIITPVFAVVKWVEIDSSPDLVYG